MKLFDLSGRRALITGSSMGIGFALAKGLSAAGAQVVLNARNAERLEEAAEKLRATGADVLTLAFDVPMPPQRAKRLTLSRPTQARLIFW